MKNQNNDIISKLESLSAVEFLALGMDGLAYIKPLGIVNDTQTYAVNAADGTHIATGPDKSILQAIAQQQNLTAVTVH
jgi:hypothetical protein